MKFEDTNVSVNPRAYSQPEEDVGPTDNFRWENMYLLIFGRQHMSVYALGNQRATNLIIAWTCGYSKFM